MQTQSNTCVTTTLRWTFPPVSPHSDGMNRTISNAAICLLLAFSVAQAGEKAPLPPTRIALISDIHIMRGTNTTDRMKHRKHFDQAIAAVNAAKVDLALIAGDLTEHGTPEEMGDLKTQMKQLKAPAWFVVGNHDIGNKIIPGKVETNSVQSGRRLGRFEMRYGRSYWERELPGLRVIGLNAPLCGTGLPQEKKMWNFLEKKLATPADKPTLVLLHFPPFIKNADEPGGDYFNLEPFPRQRLLSLIRQGGVSAVLSGHRHTQSLSHYNGMLFVTSPPVAFGLPEGKQKEGWTLVTVSADGTANAEFRYLSD